MDDEGNYVKPEPSVEELLRGTAWEMDPRRDATQFSMTKQEWKAVKAEARTAVYPHDAVAIFENAGLRRISPEMAASMLKLIAQKAQHSRCDREELAGLRRDPRVAHMIGTCVAAARMKSDTLAAEEVAKCCWALGVIAGERANSAELEVLANRAAELMAKLSSDEIADISWALAISRHSSENFFRELDIHAAMHGLKGFQAYQITTVAWAFAHLGHKHAGFLDGVDVWVTRAPARNKDMSKEDAAAAQVHRFNATILASLAWSFTITVTMNTTTPTFSVRGRGDNSTSYIRLPSPPCALALTRYPTSWAPPPMKHGTRRVVHPSCRGSNATSVQFYHTWERNTRRKPSCLVTDAICCLKMPSRTAL